MCRHERWRRRWQKKVSKHFIVTVKFKIRLDESLLPMSTQNYTPLLALTKMFTCHTRWQYTEQCRPIVIWYVHSYCVLCCLYCGLTGINIPTIIVLHEPTFVFQLCTQLWLNIMWRLRASIVLNIWEYLQAWKSYSTFWLGAVNIHSIHLALHNVLCIHWTNVYSV